MPAVTPPLPPVSTAQPQPCPHQTGPVQRTVPCCQAFSSPWASLKGPSLRTASMVRLSLPPPWPRLGGLQENCVHIYSSLFSKDLGDVTVLPGPWLPGLQRWPGWGGLYRASVSLGPRPSLHRTRGSASSPRGLELRPRDTPREPKLVLFFECPQNQPDSPPPKGQRPLAESGHSGPWRGRVTQQRL